MTAQEGRPYCIKAQKYLTEEGKGSNLLPACRVCRHILFIGCPGFFYKQTENPHSPTHLWVRWWYYNEPIPDDWRKTNSEIFNLDCSEQTKTKEGE